MKVNRFPKAMSLLYLESIAFMVTPILMAQQAAPAAPTASTPPPVTASQPPAIANPPPTPGLPTPSTANQAPANTRQQPPLQQPPSIVTPSQQTPNGSVVPNSSTVPGAGINQTQPGTPLTAPDSFIWDGRENVGTVGGQFYYLNADDVWAPMNQVQLQQFQIWESQHPNWQNQAYRNSRFNRVLQEQPGQMPNQPSAGNQQNGQVNPNYVQPHYISPNNNNNNNVNPNNNGR